MDQRWEKAGSQAQRLPSLSSFPQSFASPPGKNDIFAGWESRLFRKRGPTHLAPAQRSAHQTVAEGGSLQRLPLLSRIGDHCPHSCMTWYHKEASYHLFPISGRRPTVCLWGLGLVGDQGGPAASLPLLSGISGCGPAGMWPSTLTWAGYPARLCRLCPELGLPAKAAVGAGIQSLLTSERAGVSHCAAGSLRRS